ncbi:conserved unknown protein [Ectocarpus siliculosus]|uniref:Uncharacterized protein n=1 Tax=Ectocarpus siliculosus TaxID=2880 RepID=D8LAX8_ECTSI|nr:conserved unknown protein [Ectocarpus siliculosus]|eukprot:CBN76487.1 conserved unknown protein [Ectocarpus siliculosus]
MGAVAGAEAATNRPALLVTIGPQCAGKTSLLRALAAKSEVYHKIPTALLLGGCARGSPEDLLLAQRPLSDRLGDPGCVETRLVTFRLEGHISAEEFAGRLGECRGQASPAAIAALCRAVESAVSDNVRISTPTVDVFVRENLFPDAISSSQERLAAAATDEDGLVAWGNTNTQARDYRGALEQAERTGRPVRFLRWGHELPFLSLEELSRRNVCRFAYTGRYVETAAIENALARVDKLYASTAGGDPARLALAAGFQMDASGGVHSQSSPPRRRHDSPRSRAGRGNGSWERNTRRRVGGGGTADTSAYSGGGIGGSEGVVRGRDGAWDNRGGSGTWFHDEASRRTTRREATSHGVPPPPPMAQPTPAAGPDRFTIEGADRRRYEDTGAPLGLAQEWTPRGGTGAGGSSRRRDHSDTGWGVGGPAGVPPTVMFGNEWGRKREWRRTGYTDDDIDPGMGSCFFRTPANSTGVLRRSDLGEGMGADLEEMELVRRIKSFRQRR